MQPGDLIRYGGLQDSLHQFPGCLGILLRKLQYHSDGDAAPNWCGDPAWWIQFVNDDGPTWSYEEELHLVGKRN